MFRVGLEVVTFRAHPQAEAQQLLQLCDELISCIILHGPGQTAGHLRQMRQPES